MMHRKRRKHNLFLAADCGDEAQLDQLEERGYLDPDLRGEWADECQAIEMFLTEFGE